MTVLLAAGLAAGPGSAAGAATARPAATAGRTAPIPPPRHRGALRVTGRLHDGGTVTAAGLTGC